MNCLAKELLIIFFFLLLSVSQFFVEGNRELYPELYTPGSNKDPNNNRQIVLLVEGLGLANRLRSLADWYVLASLTKRKLVVSWRATRDCNAHFSDLFEDWPVGLEILRDPVPLSSEGFTWLEEAARIRGHTFFRFDYLNESNNVWKVNGSFWIRQDILASKQIDLIFTNYLGLLTFDDIPCTIYKHLRGKFLRSLVPIRFVRQAVQNVYDKMFVGKLVVGVHMRVHNPSYDWPMVAVGGKTEAEVLGENLTVEHYVRIMQRIYRYFGYSINGSKNSMTPEEREFFKSRSNMIPMKSRVRFFVTSNDPTAKAKLLGFFSGDEVFQININDYDRDTSTGIQNALIEFLLLAKSHLIIHTHGSSYAIEAAALGSLPVASVLPNAIFYKDSHLHQFCADTIVCRSQLWNDTSLIEAQVVEGTWDSRVVNVKYSAVYKTNDLNNWGLADQPNQSAVYRYTRPTPNQQVS